MDLPARIGRYEIESLLGQGGMGRVLLARDTVLGRKVALKILRDDLGIGPEVKTALFERMRQEARAAAALSHPHMVTLHDMGEEEGLGLYLVFEYIDGPTLRDRIRSGALPLAEVARLARQLGGALAHAHAAGVIHRDVKPENVMLAATGAKITDFGIARLPDSTLTRVGSILGTPAYSAPEALSSADFSAASDQFSLGATLYEALSGKRAFPGDDALTVASRVTNDTPTPLASFGGADLVLARALSKDKEKRFESCDAFGEALAASLERRDSGTLPTPRWRLSQDRISEAPRSSLVMKRTRRWQNLIAAAAVLVIVALVLIGRRHQSLPGASLKEVADAFAVAAATHATSLPTPSTRPRAPLPSSASPSASASASPSASASATPTSTSTSIPPPTSTSTSTPTPTATATTTSSASASPLPSASAPR